MLIKNIIVNLFTSKTKIESYSQEGEDIIIRNLFQDNKSGFYIDIENFDSEFSNTLYFYKHGWTGLNICNQTIENTKFPPRSRDINVTKTIGTRSELKTIYAGNEWDDSKLSFRKEYEQYGNLLIEKKMETTTLEHILKEYLPDDGNHSMFNIDLLNIHSPFNELDIITSNNWKIFRPKVVVVNDLENQIRFNPQATIYHFLKANNYFFIAKTSQTMIFAEKNFISGF